MAKRRYNGEGNIGKFTKGGAHPWSGYRGVYTDPITHKQRQVYGKTYAACKEKLDAALEAIRKGNYVSPNRETVASWLDIWFVNFYTQDVKKTTAATTESNIRVHLKPVLGNIPLQKLACEHIQQFSYSAIANGLSPSTVSRILAILHKAIKQAIILKKINRDPFIGLNKPKKERAEIHPLTMDEQTAWLRVVPANTGGRALRFLHGTGLRVSELVGLKWKDIQEDGIHIERNVLTIKDLKDDGYIDVEGVPKTESGKRIVPYNRAMRALLDEQRRTQRMERLKAGDAWRGGEACHPDTFVFATKTGNHADRHNLNRLYHSTLKKAGISERGVHTLRHTFATNAVQSKQIAISDLSRLLGHSDPAFTMKTYVHPDRAGMTQAMEILGNMTAAK